MEPTTRPNIVPEAALRWAKVVDGKGRTVWAWVVPCGGTCCTRDNVKIEDPDKHFGPRPWTYSDVDKGDFDCEEGSHPLTPSLAEQCEAILRGETPNRKVALAIHIDRVKSELLRLLREEKNV